MLFPVPPHTWTHTQTHIPPSPECFMGTKMYMLENRKKMPGSQHAIRIKENLPSSSHIYFAFFLDWRTHMTNHTVLHQITLNNPVREILVRPSGWYAWYLLISNLSVWWPYTERLMIIMFVPNQKESYIFCVTFEKAFPKVNMLNL